MVYDVLNGMNLVMAQPLKGTTFDRVVDISSCNDDTEQFS